MKFGHVVCEICKLSRQTTDNRLTDRHVDRNTLHTSPGPKKVYGNENNRVSAYGMCYILTAYR